MSDFLPGVSGPGAAPALPVRFPAGLRGPVGLPAPAVCHSFRPVEAHGPGRRQRR